MNIQVIEIKSSLSQGNVKAFVKVSLGGVIIHDFKIVQQTGQKAWVALPQSEWTDKSGQKHYKPSIELSSDLKEQVTAAVLQKWCGNGN